MNGISERISSIEKFHNAIFNGPIEHYIKINFLNRAKHLEARHKHHRPWMQIEYPEECSIFNNAAERLVAVLNKDKKIPNIFDPSE